MADVRCSSCGNLFDDIRDNVACPHDKTQMGYEGWEGTHGKMHPPGQPPQIFDPTPLQAKKPPNAKHKP